MMKYIISNCPAITQITKLCDNACPEVQMCKDIPDCLLKQIVDECKSAQKTQWIKNKKKPYSPSKAAFARQLLSLLDIEECE